MRLQTEFGEVTTERTVRPQGHHPDMVIIDEVYEWTDRRDGRRHRGNASMVARADLYARNPHIVDEFLQNEIVRQVGLRRIANDGLADWERELLGNAPQWQHHRFQEAMGQEIPVVRPPLNGEEQLEALRQRVATNGVYARRRDRRGVGPRGGAIPNPNPNANAIRIDAPMTWATGGYTAAPATTFTWTTTNTTEGAPPVNPTKEVRDLRCACGEPGDPNWEHTHDECTFLDRPSSEWEDDGPLDVED